MAVKETRTVEIICDLCGKKINPDLSYINAQVYGADFHVHCADTHKPILKALGLDEIKRMRSYEEWETATKYIYD